MSRAPQSIRNLTLGVFAATVGAAALLPGGAQSAPPPPPLPCAASAGSNAADPDTPPPTAASSTVSVQALSASPFTLSFANASLSIQSSRQVNTDKCAVTAQVKITNNGERYCLVTAKRNALPTVTARDPAVGSALFCNASVSV